MSVAIRCRIHHGRTIACLRKGLQISKLEALPKICCPYLIIQRETLLRTLSTSRALYATLGGKDGKGWSMGPEAGTDKQGRASTDQPKCPKCGTPCAIVGPRALDSKDIFLVACSNCKHSFVADVEECREQQPGKKEPFTPRETVNSTNMDFTELVRIYKYLTRHVIGQEDAIQRMSTAIYNHCKKVTYNLKMKAANQPERPPMESSLADTVPKNLHYRDIYKLLSQKPPITKKNSKKGHLGVVGVSPKKDMTSLKHPSNLYGDLGPSATPATEAPVFNRALMNAPPGQLPHIQKSNLIMVGPTGSGKTLLAQSIANLLDVPFHIADCTSLTQAGYVGEDVENIIARLFHNANYDVGKCQQGIVVLDEVDKIATRQEGLRGSKLRDIAGEGVQQSLLKMIEGTLVNVSDKYHKNGSKETIDTANILFIACGAFNGLHHVVSQRTREHSVGFGKPKPKSKLETKPAAPIITDDSTESKNRECDFLLKQSNALDIVSYGFLPEFVGRFAGIVPFHALNKANLVQILLDAENSYIKEFTTLFSLDNCALTVEPGALDAIAENCLENKMGARGLRQELTSFVMFADSVVDPDERARNEQSHQDLHFLQETHLKSPMFQVPGSDIISVIITEKAVREGAPAIYMRRGEESEQKEPFQYTSTY